MMMLWFIWLSGTRLPNWLISRTSALCMGHQLLNLYCINVVFLEPRCVQNGRFSDAAAAFIDRVGLCEPAVVFFLLILTHIYSSFHVAFHVWAKTLGWSWTSPSCSVSVPRQSPRPSDSEHTSDLVSPSTPAHPHQTTGFYLPSCSGVGIPAWCSSVQLKRFFYHAILSSHFCWNSLCLSLLPNDTRISYHGTEDTSWSAFAALSPFVSCSLSATRFPWALLCWVTCPQSLDGLTSPPLNMLLFLFGMSFYA